MPDEDVYVNVETEYVGSEVLEMTGTAVLRHEDAAEREDACMASEVLELTGMAVLQHGDTVERISFPVEDEDGAILEETVGQPRWFSPSEPELMERSRRNVLEQWAEALPPVVVSEEEARLVVADATDFLNEGDYVVAEDPPARAARCCGKGRRTARVLLTYDAEAKHIVRVALPSTIGSAAGTLYSAVTSALASPHFGADAYVAYAMA